MVMMRIVMTSKQTHLSQARSIQLAIIHRDNMKTSNMVPGQIVMSVFSTNRVLNVIRLSAPMLREVVSLKIENKCYSLCKNICFIK